MISLNKTTLIPLLMTSLMPSCCTAEVINFTGLPFSKGGGKLGDFAGFKWTDVWATKTSLTNSFDPPSTPFAAKGIGYLQTGEGSFELTAPTVGSTFSLISFVNRGTDSSQAPMKIEGYEGFGKDLKLKATKEIAKTTVINDYYDPSFATFGEAFEGLTKVKMSCATSNCDIYFDDIVYLPSDDGTDIVSFEDLETPGTGINYQYKIPTGHMGFQWSSNFYYGEKSPYPTIGDDKYEAYAPDGQAVTFEKTAETSVFTLKSLRLRVDDETNKDITIKGHGADGSEKISVTVNIKEGLTSYVIPFDSQWTGLSKVSLQNTQGNFFVDDIVFKWDNIVNGEEAAVDEYVVGKDDKPKKESMIAGGVVIGIILVVTLFVVIHCGRKNHWSCLQKACGGRNGGDNQQDADPVDVANKALENTLDETGPKPENDLSNVATVENV